MRERCKYFASAMLILALVFVFVGCAKPPQAEKSATQSSMEVAVSAGADRYAVADFRLAQALWYTAETRMAGKKYKEAKHYYIFARSAFEKAAASVEAGRKVATEAANAALPSLENDWKNLEAAAKNAKKNKKEHWAADATAIVEGLQAAKDMIATDPAGAKTKIGELKSVIEKWDTVFKGLAAAPAKPYTPKKG